MVGSCQCFDKIIFHYAPNKTNCDDKYFYYLFNVACKIISIEESQIHDIGSWKVGL